MSKKLDRVTRNRIKSDDFGQEQINYSLLTTGEKLVLAVVIFIMLALYFAY